MQSAGSILSFLLFMFVFLPPGCCPSVTAAVVAADYSPLLVSSSSLERFREERKFGRRPISAKRIAAGSWEPLPCYYARRKGEVRRRLSIIRYIGNEFRNDDGEGRPFIITAARRKVWQRARAPPLFREGINRVHWRLLHTRWKKVCARVHTHICSIITPDRFSLASQPFRTE